VVEAATVEEEEVATTTISAGVGVEITRILATSTTRSVASMLQKGP
jgi:hypothetical protein